MDGKALVKDVNAVNVVLDHFLQAVELAFDDINSFSGKFFGVLVALIHAKIIYPLGVSVNTNLTTY